MRDLAYKRPRYGVRRIHVLLKREGLVVNHKRTEGIYKQEGLAIRTRKYKKLCQPMSPQERHPLKLMNDGQWTLSMIA
jgi:putative transposase